MWLVLVFWLDACQPCVGSLCGGTAAGLRQAWNLYSVIAAASVKPYVFALYVYVAQTIHV